MSAIDSDITEISYYVYIVLYKLQYAEMCEMYEVSKLIMFFVKSHLIVVYN